MIWVYAVLAEINPVGDRLDKGLLGVQLQLQPLCRKILDSVPPLQKLGLAVGEHDGIVHVPHILMHPKLAFHKSGQPRSC